MTSNCESCGRPMTSAADHAPGDEHSRHCNYCSKPDGALQDFDERFERMVQWTMEQDDVGRREAEAKTRAYMRTMPLWQHHPELA